MGNNKLQDNILKTAAKILMISDEPDTARVWACSLKELGMEPMLISCNSPVFQEFYDVQPELIIIEDLNVKIDEIELCRKLRAETEVPILFLTTKTNEAFCLEVYKTGADDCISFPISPRLFQAKVKAWLRRAVTLPLTAQDEIRVGGFCLNPDHRQIITPMGKIVKLSVLEARVLYILMSNPGRLFETNYLIDRVWGYYGNGDKGMLKSLIYRLRRKIEPKPERPRYIVYEINLGYCFKTQ